MGWLAWRCSAEVAERQLEGVHKVLRSNETSVSDLSLYTQELEKEVARLNQQVRGAARRVGAMRLCHARGCHALMLQLNGMGGL